jgi:hypothetical protein
MVRQFLTGLWPAVQDITRTSTNSSSPQSPDQLCGPRNEYRDSSVGIATRYGLDGPGIDYRCGSRFSAPVQTGPGAHPASNTWVTESFRGVKRSGRGVDHTPTSSAEVKERVRLYFCATSEPSWPVIGWILPYYLYLTGVLSSGKSGRVWGKPLPSSAEVKNEWRYSSAPHMRLTYMLQERVYLLKHLRDDTQRDH